MNTFGVQTLRQGKKKPEWVAFIQDEAARAVFLDFASHQHKDVLCLSLEELGVWIRALDNTLNPKILFIEISYMNFPFWELQKIVETKPIDMQVITLGVENDITRYRQLQKIGIDDYLFLPLTEELLMQACVEPGMRPLASNQKMKNLFPILGVRGGVGATTVALNVSYTWQRLANQSVSLLDLDVQGGDLGLQLNLSEQMNLQDIFSESERIDMNLINALLLPKKENFYVVPNSWSLMSPYQEDLVDVASFQNLLMYLYEKVDAVFIDMSYPFNKTLAQSIFSHASTCFVVLDFSLSATRDALLLIQWLKLHAPDLKIKLIANLSRPGLETSLVQKSLEDALEKTIDLLLPYCQLNMQKSAMEGELYVEKFPKTPYSKNLEIFLKKMALEYGILDEVTPTFFQRLRAWL